MSEGKAVSEWIASIILAPDGTIIGADSDLWRGWLGQRLSECVAATQELRDAARRLEAGHSDDGVEVRVGEQRVRVSVVEVIPLRRAPTDLAALLWETMEVLRQQAVS